MLMDPKQSKRASAVQTLRLMTEPDAEFSKGALGSRDLGLQALK